MNVAIFWVLSLSSAIETFRKGQAGAGLEIANRAETHHLRTSLPILKNNNINASSESGTASEYASAS